MEGGERYVDLGQNLQRFIEAGVVLTLIGPVKQASKPGMILWAHRPPGIGFEISIGICRKISSEKPIIMVDDLLPKEAFKRTDDEQNRANIEYSDFFTKRGCRPVFLSDCFGSSYKTYVDSLWDLSDRMSLNNFLHLLPDKKKHLLNELTFFEVIHTLNHTLSTKIASSEFGVDLAIVPSFNQAAFMLYRKTTERPISALVTPKFGSEEDIKKKIELLKSL